MKQDSTWRTHRGGPCPVEDKVPVEVRFRNGREQAASPAGYWRWQAWPEGPSDWDIVAWRLGDDGQG